MAIRYTNDMSTLSPAQLNGFFVGWPEQPDPETHLDILRKSYKAWIALDGQKCVGFINALSDGLFSAYIPFLEVLPEYRGTGIGSELVRRIIANLENENMYAIDMVCDESVASFYEHRGFSRCVGMVKRNDDHQGAANQPLQRGRRG